MNSSVGHQDSFPRQFARTQRLTLGEPRSFTVSRDGSRVVFTRSRSGSDNVNTLWVLDTATGIDTEVFDPATLGANDGGVTPEERRRRERAREGAGGIVSYSCDALTTRAVTVVGSQVVIIDLDSGQANCPDIAPGVFDARFSPDGTMLAYVRDGALCISDMAGNERILARDASPEVSWGLAEFIAAEEMGRHHGYWWSPDSSRIAACRVDDTHVPVWHIADPSHPDRPPAVHRYPAAGAPNAAVSLHVIDVADAARVDADLGTGWEYLTSVSWEGAGLLAQTQPRDQRRVDVHSVDPLTGETRRIWSDTDEAWVELVPGVPALDSDGRLVCCSDRHGTRQIFVDDRAVTPPELQVRAVVSVTDNIVFVANHLETPWIHDAWSVRSSGSDDPAAAPVLRLTDAGGVVTASGSAGAFVTRTTTLSGSRATFTFTRASKPDIGLFSAAEEPLVTPNVRIERVGAARTPVAILTPRDGSTARLPVLFDPYGGPHAQRVLASRSAFATSQWFADQGFVVVVADNSGTPGRGAACERAVHRDLAAPVLADQVEVALALADIEPRADMTRVGIRGWSFGGYLAALAVLRRPDIFTAAVAGAPVTEWRLYDTHYTERYLGNPVLDEGPYRATSLLEEAHLLERPLLLVHGLADDNVVAAHTLLMSSALLAAGKPHEVLPLVGVTHMTPQEVVAENLLLHQLEFLRRHLGA